MRALSTLLVVSLLSSSAVGCHSALTGPWPPIESATQEYRLGPGDVLRISVYGNNDLSSRVTVRPDGRVTLPLINEIMVQGKTVNDVTLEVTEGYRRFVQDARVAVIIEEVHSYRVFVVGKVVRPGDFESRTAVTVMQALSLAGGAARGADVDHIVVLRNGPGGRHERYEVSYNEIAEGRLQQNFTLRSGDTVIVP